MVPLNKWMPAIMHNEFPLINHCRHLAGEVVKVLVEVNGNIHRINIEHNSLIHKITLTGPADYTHKYFTFLTNPAAKVLFSNNIF